jgi:hypothetical protein
MDSVAAAVRAARDRLFAGLLHGLPSQLDNDPGAPPLESIVETVPGPELPVQLAQTIAIGQIDDLNPRIMPGAPGVYTEYHITVSSVLVNRSAWHGTSFDLLALGGFAQVPEGRVVAQRLHGVGRQLESGNTYLMFVNYRAFAECFTVVKLWEIRNGIVVATSRDDLARVRVKSSSVDGSPIALVVGRLRAAIAALQPPSN